MSTVGTVTTILNAHTGPLEQGLSRSRGMIDQWAKGVGAQFGEQSALGSMAKMMRGAGAIAGAQMIGSAISGMIENMGRLDVALAKGEISTGQYWARMGEGIPIIGGIMRAFREAGEAMEKYRQEQARIAAQHRLTADITRQSLAGQRGMIGLEGYDKERAKIEEEYQAKLRETAVKRRSIREDTKLSPAQRKEMMGLEEEAVNVAFLQRQEKINELNKKTFDSRNAITMESNAAYMKVRDDIAAASAEQAGQLHQAELIRIQSESREIADAIKEKYKKWIDQEPGFKVQLEARRDRELALATERQRQLETKAATDEETRKKEASEKLRKQELDRVSASRKVADILMDARMTQLQERANLGEADAKQQLEEMQRQKGLIARQREIDDALAGGGLSDAQRDALQREKSAINKKLETPPPRIIEIKGQAFTEVRHGMISNPAGVNIPGMKVQENQLAQQQKINKNTENSAKHLEKIATTFSGSEKW